MAMAVDTRDYCTFLISHVLDYHLIQMKIDGFIEQAFERHLEHVGQQECVGGVATTSIKGVDKTPLGMKDIGGILIFPGILTFIAIVYTLMQYFFFF
jgi:hypothetical protein